MQRRCRESAFSVWGVVCYFWDKINQKKGKEQKHALSWRGPPPARIHHVAAEKTATHSFDDRLGLVFVANLDNFALH